MRVGNARGRSPTLRYVCVRVCVYACVRMCGKGRRGFEAGGERGKTQVGSGKKGSEKQRNKRTPSSITEEEKQHPGYPSAFHILKKTALAAFAVLAVLTPTDQRQSVA